MDGKYHTTLRALSPRGDAWPKDEASVWQRLLAAFAETFQRIDDRAIQLHNEADPRTATETISDWEDLCGLPCDCVADQAPTDLEGRRAAVVAHILSDSGFSIIELEAMCAALGWDVSISEFRPFRAGAAAVGDAITNPSAGWPFAFTVEAAFVPVTRFQAGSAVAGTGLALWGNRPLECQIEKTLLGGAVAIHQYNGATDDLPKIREVEAFHQFRAGKHRANDPLDFLEFSTFRRSQAVERSRLSSSRQSIYVDSIEAVGSDRLFSAGIGAGLPLDYTETFLFRRQLPVREGFVNPSNNAQDLYAIQPQTVERTLSLRAGAGRADDPLQYIEIHTFTRFEPAMVSRQSETRDPAYLSSRSVERDIRFCVGRRAGEPLVFTELFIFQRHQRVHHEIINPN